MSKIILTSLEELKTLIVDSVNACLKHHEKINPITIDDDNEFLDAESTCQFLKIARPTLYSKVSKRQLISYKRGKKLYFKKSELLQWIDSGRRTSMTELKAKASTYTKS